MSGFCLLHSEESCGDWCSSDSLAAAVAEQQSQHSNTQWRQSVQQGQSLSPILGKINKEISEQINKSRNKERNKEMIKSSVNIEHFNNKGKKFYFNWEHGTKIKQYFHTNLWGWIVTQHDPLWPTLELTRTLTVVWQSDSWPDLTLRYDCNAKKIYFFLNLKNVFPFYPQKEVTS